MPFRTMPQALCLAVALAGVAPGLASAQTAPAANAPPLLSSAPAARPISSLPDITYEELIGSPDRAAGGYSATALGLGAIGGVLVFNAVGSAVAGPVTAGVALESALATSRVYAVGSAVVGALIGQWIYDRTLAR
jgi:hypothetical protein